MIVLSPTSKSKVLASISMEVSIFLTVTVIVVEFSAYMPSPPTVKVTVAVPSLMAVITPFSSTVTTPELSGT